MAIIYVDSNATAGGDTGADWANAYVVIATALGVWTTSDKIYLAFDHSETITTALTAGNATFTNPVPIYSIDPADDSFTKATSPQITQTSGNLSPDFDCHWHGCFFSTSTHFTLDTTSNYEFTDCDLDLTGTESTLQVGQAGGEASHIWRGGTIDFQDTNYINGVSSCICLFEGIVFGTGSPHAGGAIRPSSSRASLYRFIGCDLSAFASDILVDASQGGNRAFEIYFIGCELATSYTLSDDVFSTDTQIVELIGCDITGASTRTFLRERNTDRGDVATNETTYHDAGWEDVDGTTRLSHVMTPVTGCAESKALRGFPIMAYVATTGSKTWTVEIVENYTTALQDDECWLELFYLGTTNSTLWTLDNGRDIEAGSNLGAGTGLANWTAEPSGSRSVKLTTTATVNKTGTYMARVALGKFESGKVLHYDPLVTVA